MKFGKYLFFICFIGLSLVSCKKRGCTDYEALNYDPEAKQDDNSCYYYWIGQNYQGGKIFYIDRSRKHGLIAAEFDLPKTVWGCYGDSLIGLGINETSVGSGGANSQLIYETCGSNTAAGRCLELDTLGFDDWFLPSMEEMRGVSQNLGTIGQSNLTQGYYWTSSQATLHTAWLVLNANQSPAPLQKQIEYRVRPIRSF